jgi:hypothetical protein
VSLLGAAMGLDLADEYKSWKLAGAEEAVVAAVGPERVGRVGERFFRDSLLPELLRRPAK